MLVRTDIGLGALRRKYPRTPKEVSLGIFKTGAQFGYAQVQITIGENSDFPYLRAYLLFQFTGR